MSYKDKEDERKYRIEHKEDKRKYDKQYRIEHKEDKRKYIKQYRIEHRLEYRLEQNLRRRLRYALKGNKKCTKTWILIGCSKDFLKEHLQQTAIKNGYLDFDINNYSGKQYHIDHIIPCSSFDLEKSEEQEKCFHYTNLQILTASENLKKSNNYIKPF